MGSSPASLPERTFPLAHAWTNDREVDQVTIDIDPVDSNPNALPPPKSLAVVTADEAVGPRFQTVDIVCQAANRHKPLNKEIRQLDKKAKFLNVDNHGVKLLANAFRHESGLAPFVEFHLGSICAPFPLTRFPGQSSTLCQFQLPRNCTSCCLALESLAPISPVRIVQ